jgi:hypothetical protein
MSAPSIPLQTLSLHVQEEEEEEYNDVRAPKRPRLVYALEEEKCDERTPKRLCIRTALLPREVRGLLKSDVWTPFPCGLRIPPHLRTYAADPDGTPMYPYHTFDLLRVLWANAPDPERVLPLPGSAAQRQRHENVVHLLNFAIAFANAEWRAGERPSLYPREKHHEIFVRYINPFQSLQGMTAEFRDVFLATWRDTYHEDLLYPAPQEQGCATFSAQHQLIMYSKSYVHPKPPTLYVSECLPAPTAHAVGPRTLRLVEMGRKHMYIRGDHPDGGGTMRVREDSMFAVLAARCDQIWRGVKLEWAHTLAKQDSIPLEEALARQEALTPSYGDCIAWLTHHGGMRHHRTHTTTDIDFADPNRRRTRLRPQWETGRADWRNQTADIWRWGVSLAALVWTDPALGPGILQDYLW